MYPLTPDDNGVQLIETLVEDIMVADRLAGGDDAGKMKNYIKFRMLLRLILHTSNCIILIISFSIDISVTCYNCPRSE